MRAEDILRKGLELIKSKGEDYTENVVEDQHQNFDRSNLIASWFKKDEDKSFAVLIGVKLARIASLRNADKAPNNESLLDTFTDGSNYFALWGSKVIVEPKPKLCYFCSMRETSLPKFVSGNGEWAHYTCYKTASSIFQNAFDNNLEKPTQAIL